MAVRRARGARSAGLLSVLMSHSRSRGTAAAPQTAAASTSAPGSWPQRRRVGAPRASSLAGEGLVVGLLALQAWQRRDDVPCARVSSAASCAPRRTASWRRCRRRRFCFSFSLCARSSSPRPRQSCFLADEELWTNFVSSPHSFCLGAGVRDAASRLCGGAALIDRARTAPRARASPSTQAALRPGSRPHRALFHRSGGVSSSKTA